MEYSDKSANIYPADVEFLFSYLIALLFEQLQFTTSSSSSFIKVAAFSLCSGYFGFLPIVFTLLFIRYNTICWFRKNAFTSSNPSHLCGRPQQIQNSTFHVLRRIVPARPSPVLIFSRSAPSQRFSNSLGCHHSIFNLADLQLAETDQISEPFLQQSFLFSIFSDFFAIQMS